MHLEQGQVWKKDDRFLRIVVWERMAIEYKELPDPGSKGGEVRRVTKKEFCRMLKGAVLHVPDIPPGAES
jgi:hypothetical protein